MGLSGDDALALAKSYTQKTAEGMGAVKGKDGFSPIIKESPDNTGEVYKLSIQTETTSFTTTNLKGKNGTNGTDGTNGKSAYEIAKEEGFSGTITEWLSSLNGRDGINGLDGISPTIAVNTDTDSEYKLDITDKNGTFTTPNLKGGGGGGSFDLTDYYTKIEVDELIKDVPKGEDGFSPALAVKEQTDTTYVLTVTDANGTFDTPNLKGENGINGADGEKGTDGKSAYQVAVDNGYSGDESDWLASLKGVDGLSLQSVKTDNVGNVTAIYTDGTEKLIGNLKLDVSADFLTDTGFGNLRYVNGKFQYYDKNTNIWVDTSVSPENPYIFNLTPQPMELIIGVYDSESGKYKLKWIEPKDTVIEGQLVCMVDKVVIRRKMNACPESETDGDLVIEISRAQFGAYKDTWYIDSDSSPAIGDTYYYKAFPVSTTGFYGKSKTNETGGILAKDYELYGFEVNQNESDPVSMISYLEDNRKFRSAKMNYITSAFDYGDWKDSFFMKIRPCMLKYDGTVGYYLNPEDYSKKEDGTDSDISNTSYGGNAMVQFPKVYWKIVDKGNGKAEVYIANKKVDNEFHCWSHLDNNGNEIDYCYLPVYNGSVANNKMRSLSGKTPIASTTRQQEINYAKANNTGSDILWNTEIFSDWMLVNLLLLLIGKSTDTQAIFGTGNNNSYVSASDTGIKATGTMNAKGLFWGNQDNVSGVKVFGIEHWWGNIWRSVAGWVNANGVQKVKMTHGKSDGSTANGYNLDGSGYVTIGNATPAGTNGGYISRMLFSELGLIPVFAGGSASTYYTDGFWFNNGQNDYALVGGGSDNGLPVGALCSFLCAAASGAGWAVGASLSCKPLA